MKNGNNDSVVRNENFRNDIRDNKHGTQNVRRGGIRLSWSWLFRLIAVFFTAGTVFGMWGWEKFTQRETEKIRAEMLVDLENAGNTPSEAKAFVFTSDNVFPSSRHSDTSAEDASSATTKPAVKAVGMSREKAMEFIGSKDTDSEKEEVSENPIDTTMSDMFDDFVKSAQAGIARFLGTEDSEANSAMDGRRVTQVTADFNVRTNHKLTAKALNSVLGGVLKGKGETFIEAGKKYGISPAFLAGISMHECANGTSRQAKELHNVMGVMIGKTPKEFDSVEDCIDYMASRLKKSPCYKSGKTIAQIQKVYCPVGAENDPTRLNKYWTNGVVERMNEILEKDTLLASNSK